MINGTTENSKEMNWKKKIASNSDRIRELEAEIEKLRQENLRLEHQQNHHPTSSASENGHHAAVNGNGDDPKAAKDDEEEKYQWKGDSHIPPVVVKKLSSEHVERYSRQLILQEGFGVQGQLKLLSSSVLVVGAGGIGSTVLMYLAASGIGSISVIDFDQVEICNLHRQVIHKSSNVGMNKAYSACQTLQDLNPSIQYQALPFGLTHDNALEIISKHDVVVDASDNPQTRYLINDACVLANKPLISGSAIGTEGQLTVYNYNNGPCYRCLYPKPAATSADGKSCSDNGVLGPVPGFIGILQATETLKVLTNTGNTMNNRLLMYDSLQSSFLNLKKTPKQNDCPVCGSNPKIRSMTDSRLDSEHVRGPSCTATSCSIAPTLEDEYQISCKEYYHQYQKKENNNNNNNSGQQEEHILLDVRVKQQYDLCSLEGSINIPLQDLPNQFEYLEQLSNGTRPIYCMCRRGIFSVEATKLLLQKKADGKFPKIHSVKNIKGGLQAWRTQVDPNFPKY